MVYYSALHWAKKAEKSAEKCEQIQEDLDASGLDLSKYAKKGEVVHNTGDETIDGVKTFNSNVNFNSAVAFVKNTTNTQDTYQNINYIRDNALETNNIPYNKTYYTNALMDKNNKFVTYIQNVHKADGSSTMSISARTQNANGENVTSSIGVEATKNGDVVATAPVPTASNSMDSKRITTIGWVNDPSASLNVVHRTGDETIRGDKTYVGNVNFDNSTYTGVETGFIYQTTAGQLAVGVRDKTGLWKNGIRIHPNGKIDMVTPPTSDSNSNEVATTSWVNTTLTTAISEFVKGGDNYIKIPVEGKTNPLIIQWGQVTGLTAAGTSSKTVTLPTAFTSTNYRLSITSNYSSRTQNSATAIDTTTPRTTTAFTFHSSYASEVDWIAIGY